MSSRLGQLYNTTVVGGTENSPVQSPVQAQNGSGTGTTAASSAASVIANQPTPYYHGHRGHKRGHSYGGVVSPPSSGIHHSQLEARPSHPNTHHGALPSHGTISSSALQKGHRRALSGTMPMVGMGAVAWSSLRELEAQSSPMQIPISTVRSLSPEESRPSSPEGIVTDRRNTLKLTPVSPRTTKKSVHPGKNFDSMECGMGPCHLPKCFQAMANIKFFVCILALLVTIQQAVASGYVNSVITTIETRFEIPSRFSGLVASSYEMGNVVTVLFVSYLGAKRHIPRWIAIGVLVMVIGCVVFTLPHFLSKDRVVHHHHHSPNSYVNERLMQSNDSDSNNNDTNIESLRRLDLERKEGGRNSVCQSANPKSSQFISGATARNPFDTEPLHPDGEKQYPSVKQELMSYGCSNEVEEEGYGHPLILFMLAQLLLGCGGSPLFTLGITYVDDHVPTESSSVYIACVYAMAAFGPVLGFLVGAGMLSIPSSVPAGPDERFIGLWWGGFLIAGALLFIISLPFLTFPRLAPRSIDKEEDEYSTSEKGETAAIEDVSVITPEKQPAIDATYGQSIRDIPHSIWRLITNPTYVVTCLGGCMELNIVSGFIVFLPKYLETQFSLGKSQASLYTGGIAIPGACLGIFAGGYVMKKLELKPSGAAKFVVMTNILCLLGYVLFFFLGCTNPNLAGATTPYPGTSELADFTSADVNLTSPCNSECMCDSSLDSHYVCHQGVTFFTPCHAGCSFNMTQCSCAGGENVTPGMCTDQPCNTLLPFMIVLFFMTGTVAVTQMPLLMIVLRSVSSEERSFALGMQFVIFRLLGYIPSPIIFGNVIDSSCLLWSVKRCSSLLPAVSGRCLLYDVQDFRYKYVGVLSGLKLLALALFSYDYFQLRKLEKNESARAALESENLKHSASVISLNKLVEESDAVSATTATTTATLAT